MLSLAHGQAATTVENCAWYDATHTANYPKGCNTDSHKDGNDPAVTFSQHSKASSFGRTGSGTPFAKTTHNGQPSGVADVNGCMWQPILGAYGGSTFGVAKESVKMHDFTKDNVSSSSMYDTSQGMYYGINTRWGNGSNVVFPSDAYGVKRAACGVFPKANTASSNGTALFGNDYAYLNKSGDASCVLLAAGNFHSGENGGVWHRFSYYNYWDDDEGYIGFRIAGYAK